MLPLTGQSWGLLRTEVGIESQVEWVKHLVNLHDGEVRFVGEPRLWRVSPKRRKETPSPVEPSSLSHDPRK